MLQNKAIFMPSKIAIAHQSNKRVFKNYGTKRQASLFFLHLVFVKKPDFVFK